MKFHQNMKLHCLLRLLEDEYEHKMEKLVKDIDNVLQEYKTILSKEQHDYTLALRKIEVLQKDVVFLENIIKYIKNI